MRRAASEVIFYRRSREAKIDQVPVRYERYESYDAGARYFSTPLPPGGTHTFAVPSVELVAMTHAVGCQSNPHVAPLGCASTTASTPASTNS